MADWARLLSECWGLNLSRGFESRPPRLNQNASERARFGFKHSFNLEPKLNALRINAQFTVIAFSLIPNPNTVLQPKEWEPAHSYNFF